MTDLMIVLRICFIVDEDDDYVNCHFYFLDSPTRYDLTISEFYYYY